MNIPNVKSYIEHRLSWMCARYETQTRSKSFDECLLERIYELEFCLETIRECDDHSYKHSEEPPCADGRAKVGDVVYVPSEGWSGKIKGITDLLRPEGGRMLTISGPNKTLVIINE